MLNRLWTPPLILAGVIVGLLGLLLLPGSTTVFGGWFNLVSAVAMIVVGLLARQGPNPGSKGRPLPWVAALLLAVAVLLCSRQANIMLLDAGVQMEGGEVAVAKREVAATLRDPASAIFTEVKSNGFVVCGKVNGKNGFGGYAGATRFVWQEGFAPEIESDIKMSGFPEVDQMKRCFFNEKWAQCQGSEIAPTAC